VGQGVCPGRLIAAPATLHAAFNSMGSTIKGSSFSGLLAMKIEGSTSPSGTSDIRVSRTETPQSTVSLY
jgi:hypothetical protein